MKPVFDLEQGIVVASCQCMEEVKATLSKLPFTKYGVPAAEQKTFEIFVEFLFFFLHFTSRQAYSRLPRADANHLLQAIGESVLSSAVDVFIGHWPDDLKARVQSELYSNLNHAEQEYAECKQLSEPILPSGRVRTSLDDTAMLSRLAFHVLSKGRQEQEIDPKEIDTETAVLADMVQTVVKAKLVEGDTLHTSELPDIRRGALNELGVLVARASAALRVYEKGWKILAGGSAGGTSVVLGNNAISGRIKSLRLRRSLRRGVVDLLHKLQCRVCGRDHLTAEHIGVFAFLVRR